MSAAGDPAALVVPVLLEDRQELPLRGAQAKGFGERLPHARAHMKMMVADRRPELDDGAVMSGDDDRLPLLRLPDERGEVLLEFVKGYGLHIERVQEKGPFVKTKRPVGCRNGIADLVAGLGFHWGMGKR